jgi:hypothetical protein
MTLLVCLTVGAQAGIIFSSGFDGTPVPGGYTTIYSGPGGTLGPWTVVSGNVDWIRGYWQSALGTSGSVDMSGNGPGVLSTSLATIAGQAYDLSFYLAGNPDGGDGPRTINVEVGNVDESFTFPGGQSEASMGWCRRRLLSSPTEMTRSLSPPWKTPLMARRSTR